MISQKSKVRKILGSDRWSLITAFTAFHLLFTSSPIIAAEEGGHDGGGDMTWRLINFAILITILFLAARYIKVKDFFAGRRESIKIALEDAKKAKEEAEKKMREFELKLVLLDKKIEEIYQEIKLEGEIEKKRIIEEANQMADKIQKQAKFISEQEIKKAKESVKKEIARVAVEMAEEILRNEMTAVDQERLIKEYLDKVRIH